MYIKKVKIGTSEIDGNGVFALEDISKNEIVWVFKDGFDISMTDKMFQQLPGIESEHLSHTAYLSPWSGNWVYPPIGDAAEYTNHSNNNNLVVKYDVTISVEPVFISKRDIKSGEELTNNYHEFDEITRKQKPDWAK